MTQKEWKTLIRESKENGNYHSLRMALDYFLHKSGRSLNDFINIFPRQTIIDWYPSVFTKRSIGLMEEVSRFDGQFLFAYSIQ